MKVRRLTQSFQYAVEGVLYALRTQGNMRIHLAIAAIVVAVAVALGERPDEVGLLLLAISGVLAAEMVNTAVEAAVDLSTGSYHPLAKIAKNVAAGAVLTTALGAVFVGFLVFSDDLGAGLTRVAREGSPSEPLQAALAIGLVLLAILACKAAAGPTRLGGKAPSGFSALASCGATWVCLRSGSPTVDTLCVLGALTVAYLRRDTGGRGTVEVIAGVIVGVAVTVVVYLLN